MYPRVILNEKTGLHNKHVTLFFSRKTGKPVEGIDLVIWSGFSDGLAAAQQNSDGGFGYVDTAGRVVIPFQYRHAEGFSEGRAVVNPMNVDASYLAGGVIDPNGRWIIQPGHYEGLIDRTGRWIVPPGRYYELAQYRDGRCPFRVDNKWGLMDGTGKVIASPRYDEPPAFHEGLAIIRGADGQFVCIDKNGQVKCKAPKDTEQAYPFHDGRARILITVRREEHDSRPEGLAPECPYIVSEFKFGYLDITGSTVIPPIYAGAGIFSEGLAPVSMNAKVIFYHESDPMEFSFDSGDADSWGYIDVAGKMVVPFGFQRAGDFSEGLARVRKDGKWGYIDKTGKLIIPYRFGWARDFRNGVAEVWTEGKILFIDRTGKVVVDTNLEAVTF
jgi:hypothetical protein